jgi:hypothetical protein
VIEVKPPPTRSGDPFLDIVTIADADELLEWALEILPVRNRMPEDRRAALDRDFLAKAQELGADPDVLVAFETSLGLDTDPASLFSSPA